MASAEASSKRRVMRVKTKRIRRKIIREVNIRKIVKARRMVVAVLGVRGAEKWLCGLRRGKEVL